MTKAELFRDEFNRLEDSIKKRFPREYRAYLRRSNNSGKPASAVRYISECDGLEKEKDKLIYCCEVRNVLSHQPTINSKYIVEPSDEIIDILRDVRYRVENPYIASNIMISKEAMYYRRFEDKVWTTMQTMNEKTFTHVPILEEDGRVSGVFSENTLLSWIIGGESSLIDEDVSFEEMNMINDQLSLEKHDAESFRFIKDDTPLLKINEIFDEALRNNDRIGLCFVTSDGRRTSPVKGIITAWDIAAYK